MGLIYGLLCLLVILFAGAMVLSIIMFVKERVLYNADNTGKKSYIPTEKAIIKCLKCGQKLNVQHTFCPYCGSEKDKQSEDIVKNSDAKSDIETVYNLNIQVANIEENGEVTEGSTDNDLDNYVKLDSTNYEKTEPDVVLNENDVKSSDEPFEKQAGDEIINDNINILEDIYQSQNKWLNGDSEKAEDISSTQELLKASKYKPQNKKQKRRNS